MPDIKFYTPQGEKLIRSDNTIVNPADGLNDDGSQKVVVQGSYVGKSTDPKPTEGVIEGATFIEVDTKLIYIYHDGDWWEF